jgi:hypothetical protein
MGLIEDIQKELLDPEYSLSNILRKTKIVAYEIQHDALKQWVGAELNGYRGTSLETPSYRVFYVNSIGNFSGAFGAAINNCPVPTINLPKDIKHCLENHEEKSGIKSLEDLTLEQGKGRKSQFLIPWPANLIAQHATDFLQNYSLMQAWQCIGRNQIVSIIDTVRNRLLDFILNLKEEFPEIEKDDQYSEHIKNETVSQIFQTFVLGDNNVVASGSNISQRVKMKVRENDLDSLMDYLHSLNIATEDTHKLRMAIEKDGVPKQKDLLGQGVKRWILNQTETALDRATTTAYGVISGLIVQALCMYYGWA